MELQNAFERRDRKIADKPPLKIIFPEVDEDDIPQDKEFCIVEIGESRKLIRFHDYGEIYNIQGLYEEIFYEKLECQSPALLGGLLIH